MINEHTDPFANLPTPDDGQFDTAGLELEPKIDKLNVEPAVVENADGGEVALNSSESLKIEEASALYKKLISEISDKSDPDGGRGEDIRQVFMSLFYKLEGIDSPAARRLRYLAMLQTENNIPLPPIHTSAAEWRRYYPYDPEIVRKEYEELPSE